MSTHAHESAELQVSENIVTTLHRARLTERKLALAVGISQPTMNRRIHGSQPWMFWEVQAIAAYLCLTLEEMTTALPTREEWEGRWLRACRDSNPKPSVLESGTDLRVRLVAGTGTAELGRRLRLVTSGVTVNRIPAGWPIPEPREPLPVRESGARGRHLRAVS